MAAVQAVRTLTTIEAVQAVAGLALRLGLAASLMAAAKLRHQARLQPAGLARGRLRQQHCSGLADLVFSPGEAALAGRLDWLGLMAQRPDHGQSHAARAARPALP